LEELDQAFWLWLQEDYHHKLHNGIGDKAIDCYNASPARIELRCLSKTELDEIFLIRHERFVNNLLPQGEGPAMKDLIARFGLEHFPFDKNLKTLDVFDTDFLKECSARLNYIKRRGGILLLTGDPGWAKHSPSDTLRTPSMRIFFKASVPRCPP
jgi:hypothetical protein